MSQSFVRVFLDVICIALAGSIGKLLALYCADGMLKLMDLCELSFMSSLLDNCNKKTTQCNKGHIKESTDKIGDPTTCPLFEARAFVKNHMISLAKLSIQKIHVLDGLNTKMSVEIDW
jgi:hypothetical protein